MGTNTCREHLRQYVDKLNEMVCMLAETEKKTLDLSWIVRAALLFADGGQQWFWAFAGALALLCVSCCCLWRRSYKPGSSNKHGSSRSLEEEQEEQEADPLDMDKYVSWHLLKRQECRVVEDLVYDLLSLCRFFTRDFIPQVKPVVGVSSSKKGQSDHFYHLLVPLEPPPGVSFNLEPSTKRKNPDKRCRVRVRLVSTCTEQLLREVICQVHHSKDKRLTQEKNFLETFCTSSSYLDVQRTTSWFQEQMRLACSCIDQMPKHSLTVMPSTDVCTLKLTDAFDRSTFIELALAVQQGNSGKFVTLQ